MSMKENCINLHSGRFITRMKIYNGSTSIELTEKVFDSKTKSDIASVFKWIKKYIKTQDENKEIDSVKVTVFTFSGHIVFKERFIKYNKEWITLNELYKIL